MPILVLVFKLKHRKKLKPCVSYIHIYKHLRKFIYCIYVCIYFAILDDWRLEILSNFITLTFQYVENF